MAVVPLRNVLSHHGSRRRREFTHHELALNGTNQCNVFTSRCSVLNRSTMAHSSPVISSAACKPSGRISAKLFIKFCRKAFQRGDNEFAVFRLRHSPGTEQIDHEFRDRQHILSAYATHAIRPVSRGLEKGKKR
jgi:hypothetical protein